jgi:hypothetical protein
MGQLNITMKQSNPTSSSSLSSTSTSVYQIDCQMTKKGKMFAATKRRVYWKFGFANQVALRDGLSGQDCRGEEHEIVLVWSVTSGKQFVLADGHEVHWSKSSSTALSRRRFYHDKFTCSWEMAGGHKLSIVAHATTPFFKNQSKTIVNGSSTSQSFRQFDLIVDGVSYSDMPQMFQLGSSSSSVSTMVKKNPSDTKVSGDNNVVENQTPSSPSTDFVESLFHQHQRQSQIQLIPVTPEKEEQQLHHLYHNRPHIASMDAAYVRSEPRLSLLDDVSRAGSISPSPSMPDLFYEYNTTTTNNNNHHGSLLSNPIKTPVSSFATVTNSLSPLTASPTSVMMTNPFDLYCNSSSCSPPVTIPSPQALHHQHHQSPYQWNNLTQYPPVYSPQQQQLQPSPFYGQQQYDRYSQQQQNYLQQQHQYQQQQQQHGMMQQLSSFPSSSSLTAPTQTTTIPPPPPCTPQRPAVYAGY